MTEDRIREIVREELVAIAPKLLVEAALQAAREAAQRIQRRP